MKSQVAGSFIVVSQILLNQTGGNKTNNYGYSTQITGNRRRAQHSTKRSKNQKDNSPPVVDIPQTPKTIARLDMPQSYLAAKMLDSGTALQAQSLSTAAKDTAQNKSRTYFTFIQTFNNNAVERGIFHPSDKAFYQVGCERQQRAPPYI